LLATLGGLVHQELFPNYKYQPRQRDNSERRIKEEEEEMVEQVIATERTNKPWESMPQLFNRTPEITYEYPTSPEMKFEKFEKFEENILTSPHIIQINHRTIQNEHSLNYNNLVDSQYFEPSITIKQEHEPDELSHYFDDFQIDENVINNEMSPSYTYSNDINSPDNSSNEEVNDLLLFPAVNSYEMQPETAQNSYVPVTAQVNTTIPSFYTSIMDNIPVYGDEITPILAIASASTSPSFAPGQDPFMDTPQTISNSNNSLQTYDMGFLDDWGSQELIERLDLYRS
jgi:hypothetical protein